MKIRWRQQELIFMSLFFAGAMVIELKRSLGLSPQQIDSIYAIAFRNLHTPYDFRRNTLLPEMAELMLIATGYLFLNLIILRHFFQKKKSWVGLPVAAALFILLTAGFSACDYFRQEYLFVSPDGNNLPAFFAFENGLKISLRLLVFYGAWLCIRESLIYALENGKRNNAYRILVANQAGYAVTGYAILLEMIVALRFTDSILSMNEFTWMIYFFFIPPAIILYLINIFYLFPANGDRGPISVPLFTRLAGITTLILIPFCFFNFLRTKELLVFSGVFYSMQFLLVTPLSWWIYTRRRTRILELRGLHAALDQSDARLQLLRSQINPHFLFNTLNTLYGTALQEKADRTAEGIQRLGDMMRFMLHENNREKIPMARELEYLKNYIALQKLRIATSPEITIDALINEGPYDFMITPMLLIPFIENAFKHGISLREKSWIRMDLHCDAKHLYLDICNSLHPHKQGTPYDDRSGIGLENLRQRLLLGYPGKHELTIHQTATEYFVHLVITHG